MYCMNTNFIRTLWFCNFLLTIRYSWGAFHQAFCQCFSLTTVISYWQSLHLIGWEQICQWKTLTKRLMKCPPDVIKMVRIIHISVICLQCSINPHSVIIHRTYQCWHSVAIRMPLLCYIPTSREENGIHCIQKSDSICHVQLWTKDCVHICKF